MVRCTILVRKIVTDGSLVMVVNTSFATLGGVVSRTNIEHQDWVTSTCAYLVIVWLHKPK